MWVRSMETTKAVNMDQVAAVQRTSRLGWSADAQDCATQDVLVLTTAGGQAVTFSSHEQVRICGEAEVLEMIRAALRGTGAGSGEHTLAP